MKKPLILLLKIAVSGGLIAFLVSQMDLAAVRGAFAAVTPFSVIACTGLLFAQMFLLTLRWTILMRAAGADIGYWAALRILFAAMFFTQALPSSIGGDAVRIYMIHRRGLPLGQASSTVLLDRAAGLTSLIVMMALFGHIVFARLPGDSGPWFQLLPVAALLAIGAGFWLLPRIERLLAVYRWGARLANPLSLIAALSRDIRLAVPVFAISFSVHASTALAVWILADDLAPGITYLTVLAFLPPAILLMVLPITIAGWGVREGVLVTLFTL
ncbi:MAG: lysylphosphatidylglycerol synthase transmembrane domain-containing protein, partial [Pseudomonadota bacterium]|nr:lysylphosphatidylglycerol synthase transmembrane domain-containing protein [Pseudomonadota bacterium]